MSIFEQVEKRLWRRGFIHAPIRAAVRNILIFSSALFAVGLCLWPWTDRVFWAGAMAVLFCWNFYIISRFVQEALPLSIPEEDRNGASTARVVKKGLLLRSQLRLCITGVFVYIWLALFQADPVSLAAGLTATVALIPISLIFRR